MQDVEQAIRERAYQLWVEGGHQEGNAESHWFAAQRDILSASLSESGHVAVNDASDKSKKAKSAQKKRRVA